MRIGELWRYPVKSMLGQHLDSVAVEQGGVRGDRRFALVDEATGKVASAKQPRLWRALLQARAADTDGSVRIALPDGHVTAALDPLVHDLLSDMLSRPVRLSATPVDQADIDRADPDEVLDRGVEAVVTAPQLVLGAAVPGPTFLDYAPLHLITTATLAHIGQPVPRYRPNVVIRTPPGHPPFAENAWVGRTIMLGDDVVARVVLPTRGAPSPRSRTATCPATPVRCARSWRRTGSTCPASACCPPRGSTPRWSGRVSSGRATTSESGDARPASCSTSTVDDRASGPRGPPEGVAGGLHLFPHLSGGDVAFQPARRLGGGLRVAVLGEDVQLDQGVAPARLLGHQWPRRCCWAKCCAAFSTGGSATTKTTTAATKPTMASAIVRSSHIACSNLSSSDISTSWHKVKRRSTVRAVTLPTQADYTNLLRFRTALRRFDSWSHAQAAHVGLTHAQHQLLLAIKGHPEPRGPTIGDIAGYLNTRHHSVVGLVDRAEQAGLLRRGRDDDDGRVVRLALTADGADRIARLSRLHLDELAQLAPLLEHLIDVAAVRSLEP